MRCAFRFTVPVLVGLLVANIAVSATRQQGSPERCQQLAGAGQIAEAQVQKAQHVAANPTTDAPAFCEVTAQTASVPGSRITLVYRLPDNWNGRMLGLGGGGWAGNITLATAMVGLKRRQSFFMRLRNPPARSPLQPYCRAVTPSSGTQAVR